MALSLSGDEEEYDSESEQVRAPRISSCDLGVCVCVSVFVLSGGRQGADVTELNGV